MLDSNLIALILVPVGAFVGALIDRYRRNGPEYRMRRELEWWNSKKDLRLPVKPTDWETFEREIEYQLSDDPWKDLDHQDILYRLERDMATPREEDQARLEPFRPRTVDVDDRTLHQTYCNRSPENQERGFVDICNCPRAQVIGEKPASVEDWLDAATEYDGILLPEEKSSGAFGLWQIFPKTNRDPEKWMCPNCETWRAGNTERCTNCGHGFSPDLPSWTDDAGRRLVVINGRSEYVTKGDNERVSWTGERAGYRSLMMPPLVCNKCLHELSGYTYHEHELHKQCGGRAISVDSLTSYEKTTLQQVQAGIVSINEARTMLAPNNRFPD